MSADVGPDIVGGIVALDCFNVNGKRLKILNSATDGIDTNLVKTNDLLLKEQVCHRRVRVHGTRWGGHRVYIILIHSRNSAEICR